MERSFWVLLLATGILATALLATAGCAATDPLPSDALQIFKSGVRAQSQGDYDSALLHFGIALKHHPKLARARVARGQCRQDLAASELDETRRAELLEGAAEDFQVAYSESTSARVRAEARLNRAELLVRLDRPDEALVEFQTLAENAAVPDRDRARAHSHVGHRLLVRLHQTVPVDALLDPRDRTALEAVRDARHHFDESLELGSDRFSALVGKGTCLLHERRPADAEEVLHEAYRLGSADSDRRRVELATLREQEQALPAGESSEEQRAAIRTDRRHAETGRANLQRQLLRAVYLRGVARESFLGPNAESYSDYLTALHLDADRDFTPLYRRHCQLLGIPGRYSASQRDEIATLLTHYVGGDGQVWLIAETELSSLSAPSEAELLALAIARARCSSPGRAGLAFARWLEAAKPTTRAAEQELGHVFAGGPPGNPADLARFATAKLQAARRVHPLADFAGLPQIWDLLDQAVQALEKEQTAAGATDTRQGSALAADTCRVLAEDLLLNLNAVGTTSNEGKQRLSRANLITLAEKRVRRRDRYRLHYRLGLITAALSDDAFDPRFALDAIADDPDHRYLAAFGVVSDHLRSLSAKSTTETGDEQMELVLADALLSYQGDDPPITAHMAEIRLQRHELEERREQEALKLEQSRADAERLARLRDPCARCGFKAQKSDQTCPSCGSTLPRLAPESALNPDH